jgi:hypothetical protein
MTTTFGSEWERMRKEAVKVYFAVLYYHNTYLEKVKGKSYQVSRLKPEFRSQDLTSIKSVVMTIPRYSLLWCFIFEDFHSFYDLSSQKTKFHIHKGQMVGLIISDTSFVTTDRVFDGRRNRLTLAVGLCVRNAYIICREKAVSCLGYYVTHYTYVHFLKQINCLKTTAQKTPKMSPFRS